MKLVGFKKIYNVSLEVLKPFQEFDSSILILKTFSNFFGNVQILPVKGFIVFSRDSENSLGFVGVLWNLFISTLPNFISSNDSFITNY